MTLLITLAILVWLAISVVTFGATFAYFNRNWDLEDTASEDYQMALFFSLIPFGSLVCLFCSGFYKHGIHFTPRKSK